MKIGIGSDHGGYFVKEEIKQYLKDKYEVIDFGTNSIDAADHPIYAFMVGKAITQKEIDRGILICTTGIGMSIACNKVKGIRCGKVDNLEEAASSRLHNNCNVLALSAKKNIEEIKQIIDIFLTTDFSNLDRYVRRNYMIDSYGE